MGILITLKDWFKPAPPPDPDLQKALERTFELVDPMLNTVPVLEKKLGPVLQSTLHYCKKLVAELPGPFEVDRPAFSTSPLIHALFPTVEDIACMLAKSQSVQEYLDAGGAAEAEFIYAMLAARWQRKKSLGMACNDGIMQADALVEHLNFADHVLVEPAESLESAREKLRQTAFDSLLKTFRVRLLKKREERQLLQEQRDRERDQVNVMRSTGKPDKAAEHAQRLQELDEQLRQNIEALNPENIIGPLAEFLAAPEKSLRLEKMSIAVDRGGIIAREDGCPDNGLIESIDFQEIIGRDRRRYVGMLVRIRRQDVLEAHEQLKNLQQRYLII